MSALGRTLYCASTKTLRPRTIPIYRTQLLRVSTTIPAFKAQAFSRASMAFSTKPALSYSEAPPAGPREYDPEIKDIANYIHSYKIDSDLAVSKSSY